MTSTQSHIAFRSEERTEAYLPGTGLAVWEVAWIAEGYDGDIEKTSEHLGIEGELVREALVYAAEHRVDIAAQIHDRVSWTANDVRRAFPSVRIITLHPDATTASAS